MNSKSQRSVLVRNTRSSDFDSIIQLSERIYSHSAPWRRDQLESHLNVFPEGQFVAVDQDGSVVGMAASLIIRWDEYRFDESWRDYTDHGMFTNHDPVEGHTLYGAEVMVDPGRRSRGIGSRLYRARRTLTERLGLLRIRAGARLRGYSRHAGRMSPADYVAAVVHGELRDPTLSFQLKEGFRVLGVVEGYLAHDPESLGHAAVIEWVRPAVAVHPERFHHEMPGFSGPDPGAFTSGLRPQGFAPRL